MKGLGLQLTAGITTTKKLLVLDGGLATHLETLGMDLSGDLWSARLLKESPDTIREAHEAFLRAGSDIITTASYQCSIPLLKTILQVDQTTAEQLITLSVQLAHEAIANVHRLHTCTDGNDKKGTRKQKEFAQQNIKETTNTSRNADAFHHVCSRAVDQPSTSVCDREMLVAASIGPYGACLADGSEYNGHYKHMQSEELIAWHRERFNLLCDAKADILAFETIPCRNEVQAICALLLERPSARAWVSFACGSGSTLNSGERIIDAVADIERLDVNGQVEAIGVNCTAPEHISELIESICSQTLRPIVIYPNSGENWDSESGTWHSTVTFNEDNFQSMYANWLRNTQVRVVGGCCRVGPSHITDIQHVVMSASQAMSISNSVTVDTSTSMVQPFDIHSLSHKPLNVVMDVDTGVDDALAILLAIRSRELNVIGLTTVAGNADVDMVRESKRFHLN